MRGDGVLDRQLVEAELTLDGLELLGGRLDEPDPGEAARPFASSRSPGTAFGRFTRRPLP